MVSFCRKAFNKWLKIMEAFCFEFRYQYFFEDLMQQLNLINYCLKWFWLSINRLFVLFDYFQNFFLLFLFPLFLFIMICYGMICFLGAILHHSNFNALDYAIYLIIKITFWLTRGLLPEIFGECFSWSIVGCVWSHFLGISIIRFRGK